MSTRNGYGKTKARKNSARYNLYALEDNLDEDELLRLAGSLVRLARSIQPIRSTEDKTLTRSGVEEGTRSISSLIGTARRIIDESKVRKRHLPDSRFGDAAWLMLLDLYVHRISGKSVSITSLSIASGSPATTALRYIELMIEADLIRRVSHSTDRRVTLVELTSSGEAKVEACLKDLRALSEA